MYYNLSIHSRKILTPTGFLEGFVHISNDKIMEVGKERKSSDKLIEAGDRIVMPGVIDPHVHINEPGRTEWEGFRTATKGAAAGGITTLIDMPLNSTPVTTSAHALQMKLSAAKNSLSVNCGFYGGVVPGNTNELEALLESGVFGLKAFLTHSGIDDFPATPAQDLLRVLKILKKHKKPLLVHCELSDNHPGIKNLHDHPQSYRAYLASRPNAWEDNAIQTMIDLCRETGAHVHIVHLSSATALPLIRSARKEGLPLTVETAPHYLFFCAEEIGDKNTLLKCAPPIRERDNNEQLWEALADGIIDFIATDHSPAPPDLKEIASGDFEKAWGGIAGLQFSLPATWTAARQRKFTTENIAGWMCANTAMFLRLDNRKGKISAGFDADLVIWDPEKEVSIANEEIYHKHKISPYAGKKLFGEVCTTIVNGQIVYDNNTFADTNAGKILSDKTQ